MCRFRTNACCIVVLAAVLPLTAQEKTPVKPGDQAGQLFRSGSAAYAAGDLKTARAQFEKLVRIAPRVAAAHAALGAVLLDEGNPKAALTKLQEALHLQPGDVRTTINEGTAYARLKDDAHAVQAFRSLPQDALVQMSADDDIAFAGALQATGEQAEAEAVLLRASSSNPANALLLDALGSVQAFAQQYDAAASSFSRALALNPKLGQAHAHLGLVMLTRGDSAGAVREMKAAVEDGDHSSATVLTLARALTTAGQDAEAIPLLRKLLAAEPASLDAKYAFALALQSAGQAKESLPFFAEVIRSRPSDAGALTNYGLALVQTGDAKGALVMYGKAFAAGNAGPTVHQDAGVAYLQQNDIDHALEQFQAGLKMDPANAQLHYDLGLAYKLKDNLEAAVPEFERAETLDPQLPDPPYTLGVLLMQQGKFPDAERELERTLALRPTNGDAWALLGSVYKDDGKPELAIDALRHAITLLPDQPSPHITLASILTQQGDRPGATAERKIAADLSRAAMSRQRATFALDSGRELLHRGDIRGAIVQLQAAVKADPTMPEAHWLLADAFTREGHLAEALMERQTAEALAKQASP
ncbi:MAG TPA: tetratricopeptide repeat protein [Acidobacteriaceae bacterium]|jgi:tetratricopeptide (TPR) repeat protein